MFLKTARSNIKNFFYLLFKILNFRKRLNGQFLVYAPAHTRQNSTRAAFVELVDPELGSIAHAVLPANGFYNLLDEILLYIVGIADKFSGYVGKYRYVGLLKFHSL